MSGFLANTPATITSPSSVIRAESYRSICDLRNGLARECVADITNSCVGNKKYLSVAGNKGRDAPGRVGCLVHLCEPRRSSDFPNGISPTSACPSRAASLRFPRRSRVLRYTRVSVCTHARTEYVLRNDTLSRLNSKLKGAASGVNEHDIRRERDTAPLVYWRDYAALLAFERLTNRHIRRSLHRRYVDGVWIKQDMQPANKIVYTVIHS